jgi:hypothetical protein
MIEALKIAWRVMEVVLAIVVVATMICSVGAWIRGRCRLPRAVHWLALTALVAGGVVAAVLARADGLSGAALLWITLPPIWVYVAFVFLGGPLISSNERDCRGNSP